jgi:hypothetical protein
VLQSLSGLAVGHGWLWAPEIEVLSRIAFPRIKTFDSSRAPDETDDAAVALPALDVADIRAKLDTVASEVVANDPAMLKKRIANLEAQLREQGEVNEPDETSTGIAEAEARGYQQAMTVFDQGLAKLEKSYDEFREAFAPARDCIDRLARLGSNFAVSLSEMIAVTAPAVMSIPGPGHGPLEGAAENPGRMDIGPAGRPASFSRPINRKQNGSLSPAQARILDALAWQETIGQTMTERAAIAFVADASPKSSSYANNLGSLRTAGLVEYSDGKVGLTAKGRKSASAPTPRLTHADVMQHVLGRLQPAQRRIVEYLVQAYPKDVDRKAVAAAAGASATSSSFANNLGRLRSLGLIVYREAGRVRADERLYP